MCGVITVAIMRFRNFGPYGTIYLRLRVYTIDFPVPLDGQVSSCLHGMTISYNCHHYNSISCNKM